MNLPQRITINGNNMYHKYLPTGEKLEQSQTGSSTLKREYVYGIEYEDDRLVCINTAIGRVYSSRRDWNYQGTLQDHLGNTRVVFEDRDKNAIPELVNFHDYYPFGMNHDRENLPGWTPPVLPIGDYRYQYD